MINDQNSPAGGREIGEEELRHMEQDLVQKNPNLRYSPHLREYVLAIQRGSQAAWRPSEAVRSDGQLHGSDANKENMEGFFGDMESFRKEEMVSPDTLGPTDDPEDDRHFGEERTSPGQEWLKQVQNPNHAELGGPIEENQPDQAQMEREGQPWLRRYPAAGRFGRTR